MDKTSRIAELIRAAVQESIREIGSRPAKLAYSIDEAAEALSISKRTVEALIADGELKTKRVHRRVIIPAWSVRRFLDEQ